MTVRSEPYLDGAAASGVIVGSALRGAEVIAIVMMRVCVVCCEWRVHLVVNVRVREVESRSRESLLLVFRRARFCACVRASEPALVRKRSTETASRETENKRSRTNGSEPEVARIGVCFCAEVYV